MGTCEVAFTAFDTTGDGVRHSLTVASPPTTTTWRDDYLDGLITPDTVAVGTYRVHEYVTIGPKADHSIATATGSGRIYRHHRHWAAILYPSSPDPHWLSEVAVRGLPPVRALAEGDAATLYTLDGGNLRRFTHFGSPTGARSAGIKTGFSTYRGLTLLRSEKSRDLLVATTTRGALMLIEVPRTAAFTPKFSALRTSTWQVYDRLVAQRCGAQTSLVGIDTRTGRAQVYTIGALKNPGTSTTIRRWGPVPHPVRGTLVARESYLRADDHDAALHDW
ncbi:hypothetical protein [Mobilicoccus caccae]|uniref:hypothetical protein n=1 Tax=Mobilicoccus caccae TaxID=1859295 RepID=UPI0024E170A7|nr:hypothetical protein [Mobilicoccus caccae]